MKKLILIFTLLLNIVCIAQEDKVVTLTVSGQGKTQDEAKQNALRNAIEQAFGAFISSKTEVLNDDLVKDEIVSISNGNIQKFEVISEVLIPDGGYATSLKATVSVTKLTSFVESKGIVAEFKGNLFSFNIKQKILNEQSEILAIKNMMSICSDLLLNSFDYQINVQSPISNSQDNQKWFVPVFIEVKTNQNIEILNAFLFKTITQISMSKDEITDYLTLGKKIYNINLYNNHSFNGIFLRTQNSQNLFNDLIDMWNKSVCSFEITNGFKSINGKKLISFNKTDKNFNKELINVQVKQKNYLELFSDRVAGQGYEWYDLKINPDKINSQILKLKEGQILGILQETNYSYQGSFGTKTDYSFILPDSFTIVGNFKYFDYLTLEEINKITEYKISTDVNVLNAESIEVKSEIGINDDNTLYSNNVEVKPNFPGGIDKFHKFVNENFQITEVNGSKGKIFVSFIVEKDGTLNDIKVTRDIGYGTGNEAIRVLKKSPKWIPAINNGFYVRCLYSIPIIVGNIN